MSKLFYSVLFIILIKVENSIEFSFKSRNDGKIVGGVEVSIEKYPYIVSIHFRGQHRCGGTIINSEFIITAGHCMTGIFAEDVLIQIGSNYASKDGPFYEVDKIIMHERYNRYTLENDIALLFLKKTISFTYFSRPIDLPAPNEPLKLGEKATISGWGLTSEGSRWNPNIKLRAVNITIISGEVCKELFSKTFPFFGDFIKNGMYCGGETEGKKDSCQGDSGGPMVLSNTLIGIVSWGYGCAKPDYPGVYTNVAYYRDWIDEILKINNKKFFM